MKRLLLLGLGAIVAVTALVGLQMPARSVYADTASQAAVCEGVGSATNSSGCTTSGKSVNSLITTLVDLLSAIVGIVAVVMIIIAGLKYITASGDSSSISSAKNTLIYAIVGLVIVAAAQIIVQFVITKAS